jgi:hypothetical protein
LGLSFNPAGFISGLPDSIQTSTFELAVTDKVGDIQDVQLSIQIGAPLKGDVSGNGTVDVVDVILTVNIILEITDPTPAQIRGADCSGDGIINIIDSICIVTIILNGP